MTSACGTPGRRTANIAGLLLETSRHAPRRHAIEESAIGVVTYDGLAAHALAVASQLRQSGVRPGDRVAVYLPRGAQAAAAFFGALAAGAIVVIVTESLRARQVEHIVSHSGATILLTTAAFSTRLGRALETSARTLTITADHQRSVDDLAPRVGEDPAQIIYTSGSTGLPKGVTVSHANLLAGVTSVVDYLGLRSEDRIAGLLPFSFDYGLNQLLCSVATAGTLVIERSPVPDRIVATLRAQHVTVLAAVPPLWLQMLNVPSFLTTPIESLRILTNSGGHLPSTAVRKIRHTCPRADLVLMYGLTEAFRSTYLPSDRVDRKPGSIGRAIPGAEVLVVDGEGRTCAPGEIGEIVHRGPTVTLGYWNDPEATRRVFRSNPVRPSGAPDSERVVFSGDLAYRDDEGDIFFVGRRDRMIKTLGYRVSPDEVTDLLHASGQVVEAIVTAEDDDAVGAVIVAHVVLADGGDVDVLRKYLQREAPRHLQPARIEVLPSLPRTPTGKHDHRALSVRSGA